MAVERALDQANAAGCAIRWPVDVVRPPFPDSAVLQASVVLPDVVDVSPVLIAPPRLRGQRGYVPKSLPSGPGFMKELHAFC